MKACLYTFFLCHSLYISAQQIFNPDWLSEFHTDGNSQSIFCRDLDVDTLHNAYLLLETYDDSIYVDNSPFSAVYSGGRLFKFDKNGVLNWSNYFWSPAYPLHFRKSVIDRTGSIYLTGYTYGNIFMNEDPVFTDDDNIEYTFIFKISNEGEIMNYKIFGDSAYIMQLEINQNDDLICTVQYTGKSNKFDGQNVTGNYSIVKISDSLSVNWKIDQQLDFADALGTMYYETKVNDLATGSDYFAVSYVYDDTISLNGNTYIPYHFSEVNVDSFQIDKDSFEVYIDTFVHWFDASVLSIYDYDGIHLSDITVSAKWDAYINQIVIDTTSDRICADLIIYDSDTIFVDSVMIIEPLLSTTDYNSLMLSIDTSGSIHSWITETDSIVFIIEPKISNEQLYVPGSINTDDNDIYRAASVASYDPDLVRINKAVTQCFDEHPNNSYGTMINISVGDSSIWCFGKGDECTVIDGFALHKEYDYFLMKTPLNFSKAYMNPDTIFYLPTEYYVYPNPAHNDLYISLNKFDTFGSTIRITDMLGIIEYPEPEKTYENIYKIDISQLNHGIYVLGMQINNRFVYYKFTKL